MTVAELIAALQRQEQNDIVRIQFYDYMDDPYIVEIDNVHQADWPLIGVALHISHGAVMEICKRWEDSV